MRPPKLVFLYCSDCDRANDMAFILRVRCGWACVEGISDIGRLTEILETEKVVGSPQFGCVVLVADTLAEGQRNVSQEIDFDWILRRPEIAARSIEVRTKPDWDRGYRLTHTRRICAGDMAGLQDAMKTVAARKRGPKRTILPGFWLAQETAKAVA
jgi:hypothetical protein